MASRTLVVSFMLVLGFAASAAVNASQPEAAVQQVVPPITVQRTTGTLTVIAEYAGTVVLDGVEVATVAAGEEILLGNVSVGVRRIDLRGAVGVTSVLANVKKGQNTTVTIGTLPLDTLVTTTRQQSSMPRSALSFGGGVYLYDMVIPVPFIEMSYSHYTSDDFALGGFVGIDPFVGVSKVGLQAIFGDTRSSATSIRAGSYLGDRVALIGVSLWLPNFCIGLDYSFADPGWAGEVHIQLSYSVRF